MNFNKFLLISVAIFFGVLFFVKSSLAAVYFQENFENVPVSSLPWNCGVQEPANVFFDASWSLCSSQFNPPSAQILAGEGINGTNGAKFNYYPGGTYDGTMGTNPGPNPGYNEIYVRAYIKFQPNFPWGTAGRVKLFRWYFGSKSVIPGLGSNVAPWDGKHKITIVIGGYYPPGIANTWALEDHNDGTWHLHEIHMKLNTPGTADGIIEWWIDGERIIKLTHLSISIQLYVYNIQNKLCLILQKIRLWY